MGWSLGQQARFTGHGAFRYSTAEHSVLVSHLVDDFYGVGQSRILALEALLHDSPESVASDIASPYKALLDDYKALEAYLDGKMRSQFNLPAVESPEVKFMDHVARLIEAYQLVPEKGQDFSDPLNARPLAMQLRADGWRIKGWNWEDARDQFIQRYEDLVDGRPSINPFQTTEGKGS